MAHIPVLLKEAVDILDIKPSGTYLDMTLGGFGHGRAICERLDEDGRYIGLDLDDDAIKRAEALTGGLRCETRFVKSDYCDLDKVLDELDIGKIDGCLADLGLSSFQIDDPKRGFSYMEDGPLDMRMDPEGALTAETVVNTYSEEALRKLLSEYGEERYAASIARGIVRERARGRIDTTAKLVSVIENNIPASYRYRGGNASARTFQAVRIEVNGELVNLSGAIEKAASRLDHGGVIAVISFHSLEDRIVKKTFAGLTRVDDGDKNLPLPTDYVAPEYVPATRSPITPGDEEIAANPRSRSARLRAVRKK
ncbi:MAG: 16S rRNA (cytosine(1402)-N(4))-methyltransferase RsmH [Eubacteriaceae bacterium]|nr:16S rRNA (cytosine(1402)-N(4))-methyltransferase RsmH [Eubacteriaceae bacterium]